MKRKGNWIGSILEKKRSIRRLSKRFGRTRTKKNANDDQHMLVEKLQTTIRRDREEGSMKTKV